MMSNLIIFISVLLVPIFQIPDIETNHKYIYEKKIKLRVNGSKSKDYKLKSIVEVTKIFNFGKESLPEFEIIHEPSHSSIKRVKAKLNGKAIRGRDIGLFTRNDKDKFFSEHVTHYISLPFDLKNGDTLSYSYNINYDKEKYHFSEKIPNVDSLSKFTIEVVHPAYYSIDFGVLFYLDSLNYEVTYPEKDKTTLTIFPYHGREIKKYMNFNYGFGRVFIDFKIDGSSKIDYSPLGYFNWYRTLTSVRPEFELFTDSTLLENIKSNATPKEKINFINQFVLENIRYISIAREDHSITPFKPDDILKNKYGDCKDRAALVSALARLVDLDVYMAVVTSDSYPKMDYVHSIMFDHAICCFIDNGDTIFFDPTSSYTSFPLLPESLVGKKALVFKEDPFYSTLSRQAEPFSMKLNLDVNYDSLQDGRAKFYLRNFYHNYISFGVENLSNNKFQNYVNQLLTNEFPKISFSEFKVDSIGSYETVLTAKADLKGFVTTSPTKTYLPKTLYTFYDPELTKRENDSYPIYFENYKNLLCEINISNFIGSITCDSLIIDYQNSGYYQTYSEVDNDQLLINYKLLQLEKMYQNKSKEDLINFSKEYNKQKINMYIINDRGEK